MTRTEQVAGEASSTSEYGLTEPVLEKKAKRTRTLGKAALTIIDSGASFINRMPFIGKLCIKPVTLTAVADRDIFTKEVRLVAALGTIGLFAFLNARIGNGAMDVTQNFISNQFNPDDPLSLIRLGFDAAYTAGHYACTLAQVRLMTRLVPPLVKNTKRVVNETSKWRQDRSFEDNVERFIGALKNKDHIRLRAFQIIKPLSEKELVARQAFADLSDEGWAAEPNWQYDQYHQRSRKAAVGRILLDSCGSPNNYQRPFFGTKEFAGILGFSSVIYGSFSVLKYI